MTAIGALAPVAPSLAAGAEAPLAAPLDVGGQTPVAPPIAAGGEVPVTPPVAARGTVRVAPPLDVGGRAPVVPPIAAGGEVPVTPPVAARGTVRVAPPLDVGGRAPVVPPIAAGGEVAVLGNERRLDWVLALLVWIGTYGQEYYQNETYMKTGETHAVWLGRVQANRAVAWRELELAWNGRHRSVRPINPAEVAHVNAFVTILREMCATNRLKGIYPLKKKKDVDPPLWDVILKYYVDKTYGANALMGPHLPNQAPPLIV